MDFISGLVIEAFIGACTGIMVSGMCVAANSEELEGEENEQQTEQGGKASRER